MSIVKIRYSIHRSVYHVYEWNVLLISYLVIQVIKFSTIVYP